MSLLTKSSTSGPGSHAVYVALLAMVVVVCLGLSSCGGGEASSGDGGPVIGGGTPPAADDHADSLGSATRVSLNSNTAGELTGIRDSDYFEISVREAGTLTVYTSGGTDTFGSLQTSNGATFRSDDNSGSGSNFRIEYRATLIETIYIRVRGQHSTIAGTYTLHVRFAPTSAGDDHGDSRSSATRINANSNTSGELTGRDVDYFSITVDRADTLVVYSRGNTDTVGRLEDASGRQLAHDDDGGPDRNFLIEHRVSAGTYYVRVTGGSTSTAGSYSLTSHIDLPVPPRADDHGNSRSSATRVSANSDTAGDLTAGDADYFSIVVDQAGTLVVYTRGNIDTVGRLEDASGTQLAHDDDGGIGRNFLIEHSVSAGSYHVRVTGGSTGTAGSYTLAVEFHPPTPREPDDHGGTQSTSSTVTIDSNTTGELTPLDRDYFRIVADRAGTLAVYTSGSTNTVGVLEEAGGTVLATDNNGGSGSNFRIERSVSAGTYFVRVMGNTRNTSGSYTLHVRFTASSSQDDHPNTCADATDIDLGSTTSIEVQRDGELAAGDVDYFRVTAAAGRLLAHASGNTDTVGRMESANGTELASDDNSGAGSNFRIEQSVSAGTYCVQVTGADGTSTGTYTLHLRLLPETIVGMSGDVRVNITWNTDVDLDLHVTDPCGNTLGFAGPGAPRTRTCQGFVGEWDYDDKGHGFRDDNPNAENIAWADGAPPGRYSVAVNYFDGAVPAAYTVRIFYGTQLTETHNGQLDRTDRRTRRHVTDFEFAGSSSGQGAEPSRFGAGSRALSRAARSLGVTAVEAISKRGQAPDGSSLTLAGHPVSFGSGADTSATPHDALTLTGAAPVWSPLERSERSGTWREFLHGSRFDVALGEETRVWGEANGGGGGNESRFLGFERSLGQGFAAGLAFSDTANEGSFGLAQSESLKASLTSAYRYLHFSPGNSTELWSLMGTGQGVLSLNDEIGTIATDLSMEMLAFGSSQGLGSIAAGFVPTVSADGFLVRLEAEGRAGLRPLVGEASRLQTGVLFERPLDGDGWTPRFGFGVRHEDDERGEATRTEVMAGFAYVRDRLRVDGATYYWPAGSGEAEAAGTGRRSHDSGARLTAQYTAAPDDRGLAVSVEALAGSVPDAPVWATDGEIASDSSRVHLQAGYGFAEGRGRWTPYGEILLDGDEQRVREGVRHDLGAVSIDLFGEHWLGAAPEHGLHVGLSARF